jgi:hypothetical protein
MSKVDAASKIVMLSFNVIETIETLKLKRIPFFPGMVNR